VKEYIQTKDIIRVYLEHVKSWHRDNVHRTVFLYNKY